MKIGNCDVFAFYHNSAEYKYYHYDWLSHSSSFPADSGTRKWKDITGGIKRVLHVCQTGT
jgi:hypothetical protein